MSFVLETCGLNDLYSELGVLSSALQATDLFPWHAEEVVEFSIQKLSNLAESLRNFTSVEQFQSLEVNGKNPLQTFTTAMKGMNQDEIIFQDKPLFLGQHQPGSTKTRGVSSNPRFQEASLEGHIERSRNRIASYIDSVCGSIKGRMERGLQSVHEINSTVKSVFSMKEIFSRSRGEIPVEQLLSYSDLAKQASYLESHITSEQEYVSFSENVYDSMKDLYEKSTDFYSWRSLETDYYVSSMFGAHGASLFSSITHLHGSACLRLSNESIVESMGSVIKQHSQSRGRLQSTKLSKEVFISWNGPHVNTNSIPFIDRSLSHRFGTSDPSKWNLVHADSNPNRLNVSSQSSVLARMNESQGRIVFR